MYNNVVAFYELHFAHQLYLYLPTTLSQFLISLVYSVSSSYAHSTLWLHWETSMFRVLSMVTRVLVTMAFSCWKADYTQGRSVCLDFFIPDEQHCPLWPWNHRKLLLPLSLTRANWNQTCILAFQKIKEKKIQLLWRDPKNRDTLFFGQFNFSRSTESVPISAIWSYRPILHFLLL